MGKPGRVRMGVQSCALAGFVGLAAAAGLAGLGGRRAGAGGRAPAVRRRGRSTWCRARRRSWRPRAAISARPCRTASSTSGTRTRRTSRRSPAPGRAWSSARRCSTARMEPDLAASGAKVLLIDTTSVDSTLDGLVALGEAGRRREADRRARGRAPRRHREAPAREAGPRAAALRHARLVLRRDEADLARRPARPAGLRAARRRARRATSASRASCR